MTRRRTELQTRRPAALSRCARSPFCFACRLPAHGFSQVHGDRTLRATGGRGVAEVTTAAQFLTLRRTFQGLEPTVREGGDVALQAAAGQSGRAAEYSGEGAA